MATVATDEKRVVRERDVCWLLKVTAVVLGVGLAVVCALSVTSTSARLVEPIVVFVGAWVAWRRPKVMGGVLALFGLFWMVAVAALIDYVRELEAAFREQDPGSWRSGELLAVFVPGGVSVLAGVLLLVATWVERRRDRLTAAERLGRSREIGVSGCSDEVVRGVGDH